MSINVTLQRGKLIDHLSQVCSIVEKRVDFPSLGYLHFSFSKKTLTMTSSNISMELETSLDFDKAVKEDYAILVPAHKILNLCRNMASEEVTLEFTAKTLKLSSEQGQFKMATMSVEQFPMLDIAESSEGFNISAGTLIKAIRYTKSFIAPESSRAVLQGVYFELGGKNLVAVATDGHRMACFQSPIEANTEAKFIMPRRSIQELSSHLKPDAKDASIDYREGYVSFHQGNFKLRTRLVEGNYPDFRSVIPGIDDIKPATIDCGALGSALKAIKVLINEATQSVMCEFGDNELVVKTHNNETDEGEVAVKIDYAGSPLNIVFNINYLFDVLNSIDSDNIEFYLQEDNKSGLMKKTEKDESFVNEVRFVVMPMRV